MVQVRARLPIVLQLFACICNVNYVPGQGMEQRRDAAESLVPPLSVSACRPMLHIRCSSLQVHKRILEKELDFLMVCAS